MMRPLSKREELEAQIVAARAAGKHDEAQQLENEWLALRDGLTPTRPLVGADKPMRLRTDEERWRFAPKDEPTVGRFADNVYFGPHTTSRGGR